MQKKVRERIFYLDFIRTIAVILIIITHYNAAFVFGLEPALTDRCVITEFPFGIYVGDLGVSLFLIISGAALMYVYEGDFDIKLFYKKRFWAIYPRRSEEHTSELQSHPVPDRISDGVLWL